MYMRKYKKKSCVYSAPPPVTQPLPDFRMCPCMCAQKGNFLSFVERFSKRVAHHSIKTYLLIELLKQEQKAWRYVAICDDMWRYVTICGDMWRYVAICGDMWRYMAICGDMWWYGTMIYIYILHIGWRIFDRFDKRLCSYRFKKKLDIFTIFFSSLFLLQRCWIVSSKKYRQKEENNGKNMLTMRSMFILLF